MAGAAAGATAGSLRRRCSVESQPEASLSELTLHLAGGTARDEERLLRRFGVDWRCRPPDEWLLAGLSAELVQRLTECGDGSAAEQERRNCQQRGVRLVSWRAPDYPAELLTLYRPPVLLAVRGRWPPPTPAMAMVGARAATAYGRAVASRLASAAARIGVAVVSGLARGIDRWSLEAALEAGGQVVAVLGCGIDIAYPPENRQLQERIAREGTLVSEFRLGQRPDRWTFPRRNRVIAALARGVLVVEAGARSGALITVAHALELGRDVWAVPGPIDSSASEGCNRLIADGAVPILGAESLVELLGGPAPAGKDPPREGDPLLRALDAGARTSDEVAIAGGLSIGAVRARLMALELEGEVQALAGDQWVRRRSGARDDSRRPRAG